MTQKLTEAFEKLGKALNALEAMVNKPLQEDRLYWRLLKRILESRGREVFYPKDVLQEAYAGRLIDDETLWLQMLKDLNQTSHTYDEELADKIYTHIKTYFPVLKKTYLELVDNYRSDVKI